MAQGRPVAGQPSGNSEEALAQAALAKKLGALMRRCHRGEAAAMLALSKVVDNEEIANMWLLRAVLYGSRSARKLLQKESERAEKTLVPVKHLIPGVHERWYDMHFSDELQKAGYENIASGVYHVVGGLSRGRVIVIGRETGYDPPDEDGFGAETYYSYFACDEYFNRLPGIAESSDDLDLFAPGNEYIEKNRELADLRIDWLIEDGFLSLSDYNRKILKPLPHCIINWE